jgi:hypothetical protein
MTGFKIFKTAIVLGAALAVPVLTNGCSSSNPLCCTEFQVGATVNTDIGGSADSQIAAQALADIGGVAAGAVADLTTACRQIATDLHASTADLAAADANADNDSKLNAYCALAVKQIGAVKATASGSIALVIQPPVCEASVSATFDCQAKCTGGASCDVKANPPKCTGGTLTVSCSGDCTASAGASVSCTGSCTGNCSGSCTAQGGVDCAGKCDGTCTAKAGVAGSGAQADGSCNGTCSGTCSVTAPGVKCSGSCTGKCDATCQGTATASVKCDGTCAAGGTPISCTGGKLEGGCQVDAKCSGNCNGSAQAKASCTPPQVTVTITGAADATAAGELIDTLKANLPVVAGIQTKFSTLGDLTGSLVGNIGAVTDVKAACIPAMASAAGQAVSDFQASVSATGSIVGSVK